MKLANSPTAKNERRSGALSRLEGILDKAEIDGGDGVDETRINKEIRILAERVVAPEVARASRSKKYRGTR
jgi:hypothetical protein